MRIDDEHFLIGKRFEHTWTGFNAHVRQRFEEEDNRVCISHSRRMQRTFFLMILFVTLPAVVSARDNGMPSPSPYPSPSQVPAPSASSEGTSDLSSFLSNGIAAIGIEIRLQREARVAMLAALSPEHRALVAQTVGQLAIATSPDMTEAVTTLDRALNPSEREAITKIASAQRQAMASQFSTITNVPRLSPEQIQALQRNLKQSASAADHVESESLRPSIDYRDPAYILLTAAITGAMLPSPAQK